MINVHEQFRPHIKVDYPPNNKIIFEEWFASRWSAIIQDGVNRIYLPVFWTSYYVNNNYGKDQKALSELQTFINSLDKSKKYFTILQYDDGILNDISGLDIKVFGSGGGRIDYPIPLLTMPHPYTFDVRMDVFCSFAGGMTHPIRKDLMNRYSFKYFMHKKPIPIDNYCQLLARSRFHFCPRGYGKTSFRICESLQFGAIPVYISDEFILPYHKDFNEYGVLIPSSEIRNIDRILKAIPQHEIEKKQERGRKAYQELYSYEGCRKLIIENI